MIRAGVACAFLAALTPCPAETGALPQVDVTEAYIEIHTGPGDAFPIVQVAGRHESLTVLIRHADWFKVRTAKGFEGWIPKEQLLRSDDGSVFAETWRDRMADRMAALRFNYGMSWGHFADQPTANVLVSVQGNGALGVDAGLGEVFGRLSGMSYQRVDLMLRPAPWHGLVPGLGAGVWHANVSTAAGFPSNLPTTTANLLVNLQYSFSRDWIARIEWTDNSHFRTPAEGAEFRSWAAGVAFSF